MSAKQHSETIEQRRESRAIEAVPAVISFPDGNRRTTMLACMVLDHSSEGARISVREPHVVPFEFSFTAKGEAPRKARKVWVRQNEMGLQFTG
jgi:hypothetical protein